MSYTAYTMPAWSAKRKPNAGGEPPPMAGATQERKLSGVGSSAWFGGFDPWAAHGCLSWAVLTRGTTQHLERL